eukprot:gene29302-36327_t
MLIAALPLQGNAFAGIPCAGMGEAAMQSRASGPSSPARLVMAGGQHCADVAAMAAMADNADAAASDPASGAHDCASHHDGDAAESHGKCSQCASCCTGASAPPAMPSPVFPSTYSNAAPSVAGPAMLAHVPATPKRPPRQRV